MIEITRPDGRVEKRLQILFVLADGKFWLKPHEFSSDGSYLSHPVQRGERCGQYPQIGGVERVLALRHPPPFDRFTIIAAGVMREPEKHVVIKQALVEWRQAQPALGMPHSLFGAPDIAQCSA